MADIRDKMLSAEVIVFATPVYFYTMAGQMKTLIDRCCFFYTELTDKDFYYIMTAADNNRSAMERVLTEFGGFVACLDNVREKGCIYGTGSMEKMRYFKNRSNARRLMKWENIFRAVKF